jgi:hypothetical protein
MKTPSLLLLFVSIGLMSLSFGVHEHYISLTQIEYSEKDSALQITMRFFIDDLEKAVGSRYDTEMKLATDEEIDGANALIERYIEQKFKVTVNDELKTLSYLGKQYENDEVFFFLEVTGVNEIESITVENGMLIEVFEEQQNFVKIKIGEVKKTFILIKANYKEMLNLATFR